MNNPNQSKPLHRIRVGELRVSQEPAVLQTLLGSCVSVCLFDPAAQIGGMNHILLPGDADPRHYNGSTRFGINAMELLINGIMHLGGRRARLAAKVFGGSQILHHIPAADSTGAKNVEFVDAFLSRESIPILARDVGGPDTRVLQFHTDTGAALLRRLRAADARGVIDAEKRYGRRIRADLARDAEVVWFR